MPEKAAGCLVLRLIQIQISLFSLSLNTLIFKISFLLTSRQHYLHLFIFFGIEHKHETTTELD